MFRYRPNLEKHCLFNILLVIDSRFGGFAIRICSPPPQPNPTRAEGDLSVEWNDINQVAVVATAPQPPVRQFVTAPRHLFVTCHSTLCRRGKACLDRHNHYDWCDGHCSLIKDKLPCCFLLNTSIPWRGPLLKSVGERRRRGISTGSAGADVIIPVLSACLITCLNVRHISHPSAFQHPTQVSNPSPSNWEDLLLTFKHLTFDCGWQGVSWSCLTKKPPLLPHGSPFGDPGLHGDLFQF